MLLPVFYARIKLWKLAENQDVYLVLRIKFFLAIEMLIDKINSHDCMVKVNKYPSKHLLVNDYYVRLLNMDFLVNKVIFQF